MNFSSSLETLALCYRQYLRLMTHWREVLPAPIFEVNYEDLVANQETVSRDLVDFCGLDWDERCLAFHENPRPVLTASALQVRQPMYHSSVGRWKKYRAHLKPLIEALGPLATGGLPARGQARRLKGTRGKLLPPLRRRSLLDKGKAVTYPLADDFPTLGRNLVPGAPHRL